MFVSGRASYVNVFKPRPPPPGQSGAQSMASRSSSRKPTRPKSKPSGKPSRKSPRGVGARRASSSKAIQRSSVTETSKRKQGFAGHYFFNATAARKPGWWTRSAAHRRPGRVLRLLRQASVTFYAYDATGSRSERRTNNIRVIEGERLDGRVAAGSEAWPEVEGEDEGGEGGGGALLPQMTQAICCSR
jgi:hypothetical protein